MVCGSMPWSVLYSTCSARRRLVSLIARCIDSVTSSAYRITLAVDVAGGSADRLDQRRLGPQEALLVGVQDRHQRHLGQVQPFAQQVDAHQHVELPQPQVAQDLHPLQASHLAVQVAAPAPPCSAGSRPGPRPSAWSASSPAPASGARPAGGSAPCRSSIWPARGLHFAPRVHQPGRPDDLLDHLRADCSSSYGAGVADTKTTWCDRAPATRRSAAAGCPAADGQPEAVLDQRLPCGCGRRRTCPRICGTVTCDSSTNSRKSSGK